MEVIKFSNLPKPSVEFQLSLAARVQADFDAITKHLSAKPYRYKTGKGEHATFSRCFYFRLATGSFATISEEDYNAGLLEISLELEGGRTFYEADLKEVVNALEIDMERVQRWRGGEKWLDTRLSGARRE